MTNQNTPTDQTSFPPGIWQLDPSATTVTVSAKHLLVATVPATLTVTDGTVEIDDAGQVVSVEVVADAASYTSKNPKRNKHVVGSDFLDTANHASIIFRTGAVSNVEISGGTGTLTATATVDRRTLGVDKLPSLVIGNELQLSVSATAKKTT